MFCLSFSGFHLLSLRQIGPLCCLSSCISIFLKFPFVPVFDVCRNFFQVFLSSQHLYQSCHYNWFFDISSLSFSHSWHCLSFLVFGIYLGVMICSSLDFCLSRLPFQLSVFSSGLRFFQLILFLSLKSSLSSSMVLERRNISCVGFGIWSLLNG